MTVRRRLVAAAVGAAVLAGAVLALRDPGPGVDGPPPERVSRYAADSVVLPEPGAAPRPPGDVRVTAGPTWQRVAWTGSAPGYEVRWPGGARLVAAEEVQLDGVADGAVISVRAVDGHGRRSAPVEVLGAAPSGELWRGGLTGLYDAFGGDGSLRADAPGSLWHLSGYRGCVEIGARSPGRAGAVVELGCGGDVAVLRPRAPMRLMGGAGRVAVLTDAAGPGGRLAVDLVPGPADRVGEEPPGVRAELSGTSARISPGGRPGRVAERGAGVLHLLEVEVGPGGVVMRVDGAVVATGPPAPRWSEAYPLISVSGPHGRRARVHLAGAGFSGPAARVPPVYEVPVYTATRQVLGPTTDAPDLGVAGHPLAMAASARVVATVSAPPGLDPAALTVQLGRHRMPARLAAPVTPGPGALATVGADVPAAVLGRATAALSPFVLRSARPAGGATVIESYLEITPVAEAAFRPPAPRAPAAVADALPRAELVLGDSAGRPLPHAVAPAEGRLVLEVRIDAAEAQWDSGAVAGVHGFELRLDGLLVAAVPTALDGPSAGGTYAVALALAGLARGEHVLETTAVGASASASTLTRFTVR
ncbi:hypothetical protein ACFPM7_12460 [Actinokineospora guangxiensis]|uniref:Fibronectin type-III domain-containing protein n=1 Tax=Actinokineospora guangxiensis TaxID=1490288 RepID=A0ABW0ENZ2_9PSEU